MNPYKIDVSKLNESQEILEGKELLKLELAGSFIEIISKMTSAEVLALTGMDNSDLSRIKALNLDRYTIDRLVEFIDSLGFISRISIQKKLNL